MPDWLAKSVLPSLIVAGVVSMSSHFVTAQSLDAQLSQRVDDHDKRLDTIEETLKALAEAQSRMAATEQKLSATQSLVLELLKEQREENRSRRRR